MAFIEIDKNGAIIKVIDLKNDRWEVARLGRDEDPLIEAFVCLLRHRRYDEKKVCYGVAPGPDFGYFSLASRYWRASLGIYFLGEMNCF